MKIQFLFLTLALPLSFVACSPKRDTIYSTSQGAIKGYDPVAYFTESMPVEGKKDITYKWNDANWHFASEKNRDAFKANPEAYAPQFGGYCAYAMSESSFYKIDPKVWKIVNGKLYLNYHLDVHQIWESEQDERIKRAEEYWSTVSFKDDN